MNLQEIATAIIALGTVGLIYLGGDRLRDEWSRASAPKYRWGDPQRKPDEIAWWASDSFCLVVVAFILAAAWRLMK